VELKRYVLLKLIGNYKCYNIYIYILYCKKKLERINYILYLKWIIYAIGLTLVINIFL